MKVTQAISLHHRRRLVFTFRVLATEKPNYIVVEYKLRPFLSPSLFRSVSPSVYVRLPLSRSQPPRILGPIIFSGHVRRIYNQKGGEGLYKYVSRTRMYTYTRVT